MRKLVRILLGVLMVAVVINIAAPAFAGSPHFIKTTLSATVGPGGSTLTVSGKEAGLGDEPQVTIEVTATAECINGGGNHPKAVNKASFSTAGDFPVQNGKAEFSLTLTASFQPSCSPPMTVRWSDVTVEDTTNGVGPVTIRIG